MESEVLAPAAVLVLWSIVVLFWMAFTRLPAISKMGGLGKAKPGGRGQDLEGILPDSVNWKAHNYNHLMEQPTLFYAVALTLAVAGQGEGLNATLAWGYFGLRVIHSLVQATTNVIMLRWAVFMLASLVLLALAVSAATTAF